MFGWKKKYHGAIAEGTQILKERDEALAKNRTLESNNTLLKNRNSGLITEKAELSKHLNDSEYENWQLEGVIYDLEQQFADAISLSGQHAAAALHSLYNHPSAQRMNQKAVKEIEAPLIKIVDMGYGAPGPVAKKEIAQ